MSIIDNCLFLRRNLSKKAKIADNPFSHLG